MPQGSELTHDSAVILVARMGSPKQLLYLKDKALIRIVAENVLASSVDEALVVTGHMEHLVSSVIKDLPVRFVFNPCFKQGQGTSLAAGVRILDINTSAFLVLMVDQPFITGSLINKVSSKKGVARFFVRFTMGNPATW